MPQSPDKHKQESNILLAMPLLRDAEIDFDRIINRLQSYWGATVERSDEKSIQNKESPTKIASFDVNGHLASLALMPAPLPDGEAVSLFPISYLWPDAEEDIANHTRHAIVTLCSWSNDTSPLERYKVFTKVIESVLVETNSLGLYQGNQLLLVQKDTYIDMAESLLEDSIPFLLWVYVGMINSDEGNSLYTNGMKGFGKLEMEIVNSQQDMEDLFDFMINVGSYVISNDVTFQAGETLGYSESKDARIEISPGRFLDGETIKIVM